MVGMHNGVGAKSKCLSPFGVKLKHFVPFI